VCAFGAHCDVAYVCRINLNEGSERALVLRNAADTDVIPPVLMGGRNSATSQPYSGHDPEARRRSAPERAGSGRRTANGQNRGAERVSIQLQAQLRIGTALLLAVAACICAYVYAGYAQAYRQSTRDLQALASYSQVLKAGNALAAERAPSNILLSLDPQNAAAYASARANVASARQRTDEALEHLDQSIRTRPDAPFERPLLARSRMLLAHARATYDALSRYAPAARSPRDLQAAIDALMAVCRQLDPLVDHFYGEAVRLAPQQSGTMQMARVMRDLHQSGGVLGSMLVVPLSTPEPIDAGRRLMIATLLGRNRTRTTASMRRLLPRGYCPTWPRWSSCKTCSCNAPWIR